MTNDMIDETESGYEVGRRWLAAEATEEQRSYLAAMFAGGFYQVSLPKTAAFASLASTIGGHAGAASIVDFSASPWLSGFRQAIIEQLCEPD